MYNDDRSEAMLDTTAVGELQTLPQYKTAKTITRFKRHPQGHLQIRSITIDDDTLSPSNKDDWKLAKLYAMNGAHYLVKFSAHPFLHFPQEAFQVITNAYLPEDHVLSLLIQPHLEFTRPINETVLSTGWESVLNPETTTPTCCAAQMCCRDQITRLVRYGSSLLLQTRGVLDEKSPNPNLQPLYDCIHDFVDNVCRFVFRDETLIGDKTNIARWGDALRHYLQYPLAGENLLKNPTEIIGVLTDFIFRVSVQHSAEHEGLYAVPEQAQPMLIRLPWRRGIRFSDPNQPPVITRADEFKFNMYSKMFVCWWNNYFFDSRMVKTKYAFKHPELQKMVQDFHREFTSRARRLPSYEVRLHRIAKAIEW